VSVTVTFPDNGGPIAGINDKISVTFPHILSPQSGLDCLWAVSSRRLKNSYDVLKD
jgi:hypothetical protein